MKRQILAVTIIAALAMSVQISLYVNSFPGFHSDSDCFLCHNEPVTSYNSTMMGDSLTLDGDQSDSFWNEDMTWGRRSMIPVAKDVGFGQDREHQFLTTIFGQNSTHLFMLVSWEDATINGTDSPRYATADGLAIMFNINVTDYTSANFGGMATDKAGEAVDVMLWKPAASMTGTQITTEGPRESTRVQLESNTYDYVIDHDGWYTSESSQDYMAAAIHGNVSDHNEHNYQVEMVRPLVTDDPNDVQFSESGYYDFSLAIFNATSGSNHAVSYAHSVWVYNGEPEPVTETVTSTVVTTSTKVETSTTTSKASGIISLLGISIIALFGATTIVMLRRKQKI